jgi:hypothetical protein
MYIPNSESDTMKVWKDDAPVGIIKEEDVFSNE